MHLYFAEQIVKLAEESFTKQVERLAKESLFENSIIILLSNQKGLPRKVCLNNASLLNQANARLMLCIPNTDALHCNRSIIIAEIRRHNLLSMKQTLFIKFIGNKN